MRLWTRSQNGEVLPLTMQKSRRTKERVEEEGGRKEHENGGSARRSKSSKAHAGICREYKTV